MTAVLAPVSNRTLAASILIGSCGLLVLGMQPVFLGALVQEARLLESEVGYVVTVEMLAMVIGSLAGIAMLRRLGARTVAAGAGLLLAATNLLLLGQSGLVMFMANRFAAGLLEGILVSLALVAISHVPRVERASAIFLAVQTLMQAAIVALLPLIVTTGSRADAALLVLAGAGILAAASVIALPAQLRPAEPDREKGAINRTSFTALLSAGLFLGAIVSVWSYFGLWLGQNGHSPAFESTAVALCLVAQVVGALTAARYGDRLPNTPAIAACALAGASLVLMFHLFRDNAAVIVALSMMFGFVWLFTLPSFAGWLIEIDPARRAILYLTAAQLSGSALLPSVAGALVGFWSVNAMLVFSGAMFLIVAAIAAAFSRRRAGATG